jgi:beta-galactosidase/beta-glucuronidase
MICRLASLAVVMLVTIPAKAVDIVDDWRYALSQPPQNWARSDFDDSDWKQGHGGFGTRGTPGARVSTNWRSPDIWLRKQFKLDEIPPKPALLIHHDEGAQVWINGQKVAEFEGYVTDYKVVPLDSNHKAALKIGTNLMAVHCHQTGGGQFIDVHLVDADNVPELPAAQRSNVPFKSELITRWGEELTPENAWTEYPRPQMVRENWQNLNGTWQYAIKSNTSKLSDVDWSENWSGQITVPFSLESRLGGVQRLLHPDEALWYRREFDTDRSTDGRTLLHFEAVDYRCEVFVNGKSVGKHQGGHTPFSFDITEFLHQDAAKANELVVRVEDDTEEWQLRGKQVRDPHGIWYTQVSGIWQTVWLETVPWMHIADLKTTTDAERGWIRLQPVITNDRDGRKIRVRVFDGDDLVVDGSPNEEDDVVLGIGDAKLWSPESPHLYDLEVSLLTPGGELVDQVRSYAGIRDIDKTWDADGHWRFTLNGEPIFHWGPLDQGWWPDGLLTPPSDEAMLFEIEWLKSAGFNMIRKHIKVEPRRYYYHCDRLGMMVWQDQVSAGHNPPWTRLKPDPEDANWPEEHHQQYMTELERMIDHLENHPSIVVWVPFNEAWGQHRTVDVGEWLAKRDPSRLVNVASGGNFWPVGDIVDHHNYPHPDFPFDAERYKDFIKVIGEFGGHGYPVKGHLWDADRDNWGYGGLPKTEAEYKARYVTSIEMLKDFIDQGIAGGVYTQTTDVEGEINGLMTYDRKVIKIPAEDLAELHKPLLEAGRQPASAK